MHKNKRAGNLGKISPLPPPPPKKKHQFSLTILIIKEGNNRKNTKCYPLITSESDIMLPYPNNL